MFTKVVYVCNRALIDNSTFVAERQSCINNYIIIIIIIIILLLLLLLYFNLYMKSIIILIKYL